MLFFTNVIMSVSKNKVKLHHVVPRGLSSPCSYNLPGLQNSQGHSEKIFLVQLCLHLSQKRHRINMAQPEDRATVGTDLSAELGAKTRGGSLSVPSLLKLCFGMKAINPRGLGTGPQIGEADYKFAHTKQRRTQNRNQPFFPLPF